MLQFYRKSYLNSMVVRGCVCAEFRIRLKSNNFEIDSFCHFFFSIDIGCIKSDDAKRFFVVNAKLLGDI